MSKRIIVATVVAAVLTGGAAYAVAAEMGGGDGSGVSAIEPAYSFDVNDKSKLMKYSKDVFLGRVLGVSRTLHDQGATVWDVQVLDSVKGNKSDRVLVRQLGYVDTEGRTHEAEGQARLKAGTDYLLATNPTSEDYLVLISGNSAAAPAETTEKKAKLKKEYQDAAKIDAAVQMPELPPQ